MTIAAYRFSQPVNSRRTGRHSARRYVNSAPEELRILREVVDPERVFRK